MTQKYQKQVQHKPDKVSSFYGEYSSARKEEHQNKIIDIPFRSANYYTTYAQKFGDFMWSACSLLLWRDGNVVKLGYCRESKGFPFIKQREPIIKRIINLNHIVEVVCIDDRKILLNLKEGQEKQWQLKFESRQIRFKWLIVLIMLLYNSLLSKHLPAGLNKMINEMSNFSNSKLEKSGKQQSQSKNNLSNKKTKQTKMLREYSKASNEQMSLLADETHIDLSNKLNQKVFEIAQLKQQIMKLQTNQAKLNEQIRKLRSQHGKKLVQNEIRDNCNNSSQSTRLQEQVDFMRNQMKQQYVQISRYRQDNMQLKQQIFQLKGKLESIRMEPVTVYMERQVTPQFNMVRQTLNQQSQKLRVKSNQCEKLSHEIGQVQKKYDYMLKEKKVKQDLIREYEQKIKCFQSDVSDKTKEENNKLLEQIQKNKELNMKLTAAQQDIKKLKLTNNGQLNALRGQKQALELTLKNLQMQCEQLKRRLKDSEDKLQQSERLRLRLQLQKQQAQQSLDSSYKRMQQSSTIHNEQAEKLKRQISKQKDEMKNSFTYTIKMLDDQIKEANAKIKLLQQKILRMQRENRQLLNKKQELERENGRIIETNKAELQGLKRMSLSKQSGNAELLRQISNLQIQIEQLKQILRDKQNVLCQRQDQIKEQQLQHLNLNLQIKQKQNDICLLRDHLSEVNTRLIQTQRQLKQCKNDISSLQQQIKNKDKEIKQLSQIKEQLGRKIVDFEGKIQKLKVQLQLANDINKKAGQKIKQLKTEVQIQKSQLSLVNIRVVKIQGQHKYCKNDIETLKQQVIDKEKEIKNLGQIKEQLDKKIVDLKSKEQNLKSKLQLANDSNKKNADQIKQLKGVVQKQQFKFMEIASELSKKNLEFEVLKEQKNAEIQKNNNYQTQINDVRKDLKLSKESAQIQKDKLVKQISQLKVQIMSLISEKRQLIQKITNLDAEVAKLSQNNLSQSEIMKLRQYQHDMIVLKKQMMQKSLEMLFDGAILGDKCDYKLILRQSIEEYKKKIIKKTVKLYALESINTASFHKYIDQVQDIAVLVRTEKGVSLAGFSESPISQKNVANRGGLIISLSFNKVFTVIPGKRSVTWDDYFLIIGNSEIRLKHQDWKVFSNFGIANSFFNSNGCNVNDLLGEGRDARDVKIFGFEIHRVLFE